jgi:hypothetical protein
LFVIVDDVLVEDGDVLMEEDGKVDDGEVDDGDVLDGYCELLGVEEDGEDDGVDDELGADEEVCANAPQHMPAAQRSVMSLVP